MELESKEINEESIENTTRFGEEFYSQKNIGANISFIEERDGGESFFKGHEVEQESYIEECEDQGSYVEDVEEDQPQEFTSLMPMQPMDEKLQEIYEKGDYYNLSVVSAVEDTLNEEEVIPTEYARDPMKGVDLHGVENSGFGDGTSRSREMPSTSGVQKHTQEEIINKLLEDKISFSEVADLLGDDGEDSDLDEESLVKASEEELLDEDHAAEFEKELNEQQRYHLKRKGGKERRRRRRMPAALQGLMGEANLRYARREYEEAIKMCMEIIRQFPHSPEPYQTLGMIYEEKKLVNKSLQFLFIAAFLSPNAEEWEKLAELSLHQLRDVRQAVFCYGRAIRANPQNLDYHWTRCDLLEQMGEKTKALKGYIHTVKFLRPDQGKDGLKLAKEIAKIHYENGDIHLAQEAMETAFRKYPSFVTAEDANLMLEVLIQREQYIQCIAVLVQHVGVELLSSQMPESTYEALSIEEKIDAMTFCNIPDDLPIDLQIKLAISFIHLKKFTVASPIIDSLMQMSTEEYGDLYLEVSEAYSKAYNPSQALPLLRALINSEKYNVAAVWLLFGQCLSELGELEEASKAYRKVIELAPQLGEPRLILSGILQSMGETSEALGILNQEGISEPLDSQFLSRKCNILLEHDQVEEFIKTANLLFQRHCVHIRSREEAEALIGNKKLTNKYDSIRDIRKAKNEPLEDERPQYVGQDAPIEEQWELFKKLCDVLYKKQRFAELQRLTFSALGSRELMRDKDRIKEIEFFVLLACIYNESFYFAFNIMREVIVKNPENSRAWVLLCYIISKADDFRHNRFLLRLMHKHPDSLPLTILNGHNCLVSGNYKFSYTEYCQAFSKDRSDPLVALMIGLTNTHMACQKFSGNKSNLVIGAVAFLEDYKALRTECQETYYNIGRAMHQLNLLSYATFYYKKALDMPKPLPSEDGTELDLSREIAFNLSLIYRKSGQNALAYMYIQKYIRYDD